MIPPISLQVQISWIILIFCKKWRTWSSINFNNRLSAMMASYCSCPVVWCLTSPVFSPVNRLRLRPPTQVRFVNKPECFRINLTSVWNILKHSETFCVYVDDLRRRILLRLGHLGWTFWWLGIEKARKPMNISDIITTIYHHHLQIFDDPLELVFFQFHDAWWMILLMFVAPNPAIFCMLLWECKSTGSC